MPKILSSNYITLMIFCQLPSFFAFCPSEIDDNILFLCFNIEYCVAGSLNFSLENLNHHVYAFYCRFASGLLAWILSRILGASVGFRVGGWKCLRDVVVKFKKVCLCLHSLPYFIFGILKGIGGPGGGVSGYSSTE